MNWSKQDIHRNGFTFSELSHDSRNSTNYYLLLRAAKDKYGRLTYREKYFYRLNASRELNLMDVEGVITNDSNSDEEVEDPRAELVRRLLEYERMKLAAQELDRLPQVGRDFQVAHGYVDTTVAITWPEVNLEDLQMAWRDILHRAKLNQHHTITREQLSVRDFMTRILRRLQSTRFVEFSELFEDAIRSGNGVPVIVVNFIAMLELSRESLIEITQAEPYAPIYVRLAYTPSA